MRKRHFDVIFVPGRSPLLGVLALLAGIPVRAGLDSRSRGFTYTHPVPVPETVIHEADLYLLLAKALNLPPVDRRLWFFPTPADRCAARDLLGELESDRPLVVLHCGGGSNPGMVLERKRWLPERWAVVADTLVRTRNARILLVGSADEQEVMERVRKAMAMPVDAIAQQWRWGVLAAVIERAALFLGHDTGMSLLANAVGTPHVVVFGPSDPQIYGPYGRTGRFVWRPTAFSPCFYDGSAPANCPCMGQCMRNVEPHDVLKLVDEVWPSLLDKGK
jgi:ADP-heptose:LPS heptosyltransferase